MDPTPPGGVRSWTRLAEGRGGGGAAQDRRLLRLLQELAPADGQAADVSVATLSLLVFPIATHLTNSPGGRVASGLRRVQCWGCMFWALCMCFEELLQSMSGPASCSWNR